MERQKRFNELTRGSILILTGLILIAIAFHALLLDFAFWEVALLALAIYVLVLGIRVYWYGRRSRR